MMTSKTSVRSERNIAWARRLELLTLGGLLVAIGAGFFSIALSHASLILGLVAWLAGMVVARRPLVRPSPLDLPILAFAIWELVATVTSVDFPNALSFSRRLFLIGAAYLAAEHLRSEARLRTSLWTVIATAVVMSIWGIVQYAADPAGLEGRVQLAQTTMTGSGLLMIAGLFAVSLGTWSDNQRERVAASVAAVLIASCLLFTFTRSSWLGFLVGAAIVLGFRARRLAGVIILVFVVAVAVVPGLRDRVLSTFTGQDSASRSIRITTWEIGRKMISENPVLGVGDIDLREEYERRMPVEADEIQGHLLSNPINIAVTLGLPGLAIFVWMAIRIARVGWSLLWATRGTRSVVSACAAAALGTSLAFHLAGLFEWNFGDAEVVALYWFSAGLAVAAGRFTGLLSSSAPISDR